MSGNTAVIAFFMFLVGLAIMQTITDNNAQECVVKVATVHPEWKPDELKTTCR